MLYKRVDLEEGVEVQYLGVYALKWPFDVLGVPEVGFVEAEEKALDLRITYICAHCGQFAEVSFWEVEVFDSGTTLTCDKCGQDTVFDLETPEARAERYGRYDKLLEEHKALQELLAERDEVIETLEDKPFFDSLARAAIGELRQKCDALRMMHKVEMERRVELQAKLEELLPEDYQGGGQGDEA